MESLRWQQRFSNFEKAFLLLSGVFDDKPLEQLSILEKEGVVQRFEYTFELGWKTLKDYLLSIGTALDAIAPKPVIKQAFAAGIINDGQGWIDMLESRNHMSHTYNHQRFEQEINTIATRYIPLLEATYLFLKSRVDES